MGGCSLITMVMRWSSALRHVGPVAGCTDTRRGADGAHTPTPPPDLSDHPHPTCQTTALPPISPTIEPGEDLLNSPCTDTGSVSGRAQCPGDGWQDVRYVLVTVCVLSYPGNVHVGPFTGSAKLPRRRQESIHQPVP